MLEREVKLGAGPAFHLPDLGGVVDGVTVTPPEAVRLETVYYDTPDLRLARWGVSLRYRAGEGWTLKLSPSSSNGLLERDEIAFPGGPKKPPAAALALVRAYVRKSELVAVARLSTVRRRVRLVGADGGRMAEVVDDEVSVRDGRRVAARFREIEVEVAGADGNDAIVSPLVDRLRAAGAGAPDPTPKHIRALGPRAMEPPEVAPLPVTAESPAREVIRTVLAEPVGKQFEQILNARYLEALGYGMCAEPIDERALSTFLDRIPDFEANLSSYSQDGNRDLLAKLDEVLQAVSQGGDVVEPEDPSIS